MCIVLSTLHPTTQARLKSLNLPIKLQNGLKVYECGCVHPYSLSANLSEMERLVFVTLAVFYGEPVKTEVLTNNLCHAPITIFRLRQKLKQYGHVISAVYRENAYVMEEA